jgi:hypothetical protein
MPYAYLHWHISSCFFFCKPITNDVYKMNNFCVIYKCVAHFIDWLQGSGKCWGDSWLRLNQIQRGLDLFPIWFQADSAPILQKRDGEGFLRCWDVRGGAGNLACPDFTCFHFIDATPCNKKSISHFREGFKGAVLAKMALQRRPVSPENW